MDVVHITRVVLFMGIFLKFNCNQAVVFKFTNVVCESYNKSWFIIHECRLRAINRNKTILNFNGTFLHPANDIFANGQMFKKASGYKPWLFNETIDGCKFIKKAYNPFVILVFKLFRDFTNFNHSCPFVGPQIVKGFYLRPELLRLPLPTGDYLLAIGWQFGGRVQFITNVYFSFVEDF